MSYYDNGMNFGYDQIFINPGINSYLDDINSTPRIKNNIELNLLDKIKKNNIEENEFNYIPQKPCLSCRKENDINKEQLRQSLLELQRKNDILTIFMIFIVIFIFMQYNTFNQGVHYANTLTMTRMGNPPTNSVTSLT